MYLLFIVTSIILMTLSIKVFKKKINPCTVYCLIWFIALSLHDSGLIYFEKLSIKAYVIIILFELILCSGIMIGRCFKFVIGRKQFKTVFTDIDGVDFSLLDKLIAITTIISAFAIVPNILLVISKYGISGIVANMAEIYQERESGELSYVNYFSPMIYIALMMMSVRIKKVGVKPFFIVPIILAILNALSFGGRNNIIYTILMIIIPLVVNDKSSKDKEVSDIHVSHKRRYIFVALLIIACVIVFSQINTMRSLATVIPHYISPVMQRLVSKNYSFYRTILYISEPIAYFNKYLENQYFSFGANTFYFWYKQLNKVGFDLNIMATLPTYNIPMQCNVGTYITELLIDFDFESFFIVFIFGVLFGVAYRRYSENNLEFGSTFLMTVFYIVIILSFFMWYLRSTTIWLILLYGWGISFIWKRLTIRERKLVRSGAVIE